MSVCFALSGLCLMAATHAAADEAECWGVKEFSGVSAMSVDNYAPDEMQHRLVALPYHSKVICIESIVWLTIP